jgi:hypothetical protein
MYVYFLPAIKTNYVGISGAFIFSNQSQLHMRPLVLLFCSIIVHYGRAAEHIGILPSCNGISSCVTLNEYSPSASNDITLFLLPGEHNVTSSIRFEHRDFISLQGNTPQSVIRCSGSSVKLEFIGVSTLYFQSLDCHVRVQGTNASRVSISYVNFTAYNTLVLNIKSSDYVNISHSTLQGRVHAGQSAMNISNVNFLDLSFCSILQISRQFRTHQF